MLNQPDRVQAFWINFIITIDIIPIKIVLQKGMLTPYLHKVDEQKGHGWPSGLAGSGNDRIRHIGPELNWYLR